MGLGFGQINASALKDLSTQSGHGKIIFKPGERCRIQRGGNRGFQAGIHPALNSHLDHWEGRDGNGNIKGLGKAEINIDCKEIRGSLAEVSRHIPDRIAEYRKRDGRIGGEQRLHPLPWRWGIGIGCGGNLVGNLASRSKVSQSWGRCGRSISSCSRSGVSGCRGRCRLWLEFVERIAEGKIAKADRPILGALISQIAYRIKHREHILGRLDGRGDRGGRLASKKGLGRQG